MTPRWVPSEVGVNSEAAGRFGVLRTGCFRCRPGRVLFVCVHNAGKSQMAAAIMRQLAGGLVEVRSAGTEPDAQVHDLSAIVVA